MIRLNPQEHNRGAPKVYYLMRKVNSDSAVGMFTYHHGSAFVDQAYHKILEPSKVEDVHHLGVHGSRRNVGKMIVKLGGVHAKCG